MRKALERLIKSAREYMEASEAEINFLKGRVLELNAENKRLKREIRKYKRNG